jgi:hypothetical protein
MHPFLILVLAMFAAFSAALGFVSVWSQRP